jgi:tetratricopeptide (TPR) repeat protein
VATTGGLDLTLLFLTAVLAFLLASFPARNSDIWKHLSAGRLLAHGEVSSAADAGALPVLRGNPSWLYDLACYGAYSALGGAGLVLIKALLVVALAVVLLHLSRAGGGWLLATACTALALLAMSNRFLLQPVIVSYLFLALAFWWAREPEAAADRPAPSWLPPWPLIVLFVIWANVDRWCVLGLVTVALVQLGRSLDEAATADGRQRRSLATTLPRLACRLAVLAAACLLNPSFADVFTVDPASTAALAPGQVTSPLQFRLYMQTFGLSPAALAYYPLLVLGLLSFVLNLPRPHWQRLLPWLGLAALSLVQVRAVPFFAVAAGPVLAWNLRSWAAGRASGADSLLGGVRGLAVLAGLVLVACAWPGWLQIPPFEPRHWEVEPSPSVRRAAEVVRQWHADGKLAEQGRGLHLTADSRNAFAWFCPEDRGMERDELTGPVRGKHDLSADWVKQLEAAGVTHVIVYDNNRPRFRAAVRRLWPYALNLPLLYLDGDVAVFGCRGPSALAGADPFRGDQLIPQRMAYHPNKDKRAPREGPPAEAQLRPWWEAMWKPAPPRPAEQDEAALYLEFAESALPAAPNRIAITWDMSQQAGTVAAAGSWTAAGPMAAALDARLRLACLDVPPPDKAPAPAGRAAVDAAVRDWQERFALQQDDTSPALLYLAVRAARRAVAVNPSDAEAYRILGESYMRLMRSTRERAWVLPGRLTDLKQLRYVQASVALNRAVALKPNMAEAHLRLYDLYRGMDYLDLGLDHLRTYVKLMKQTAPRDPAAAKAFGEQLAGFEDEVTRLAKEVQDRENEFAAAVAGRALVLDKARLASQKGLAHRALEMLLESDVSAFGAEGMKMELRLLLTTGRSRDVRAWVNPEDQARLGAPQYHWLQVLALAADGDYSQVQDEFGKMGRALLQEARLQDVQALRAAVAALVGQAVLEERPGEGPVANLLRRAQGRTNMFKMLPMLSRQLTQQADVSVLRGLLSLEEGRTSEAANAFREALAVWRNEADAASGAGQDFGGRIVAQDCLEWLK